MIVPKCSRRDGDGLIEPIPELRRGLRKQIPCKRNLVINQRHASLLGTQLSLPGR